MVQHHRPLCPRDLRTPRYAVSLCCARSKETGGRDVYFVDDGKQSAAGENLLQGVL